MRPIEIESWARRICERVGQGQPVEDARVELKAVWPDPVKAARRIAGHANAARGETILWLIGLDEKQGVVGVPWQELSDWWAKVKTGFESEIPALQDLNVDINGKTVAALCFDTARFPYLVKNPAYGKTAGEGMAFEVPWRDGTAIRSATRGDLVLMLSPLIKSPKLELLQGSMKLETGSNKQGGLPSFSFDVTIYFTPQNAELLVLPFHKLAAQLVSGGVIVVEGFTIGIETRGSQLKMNRSLASVTESLVKNPRPSVYVKSMPVPIEKTEDELRITGPGKIFLWGSGGFPQRYTGEDELDLRLSFIEAISTFPVLVAGKFRRVRDAQSVTQPNRWELSRLP